MTQQLASVTSFKEIAERLCAFPDADKLVSLVSHFVGAWAMTNRQNVPLDQILQMVRSRGMAFLRPGLHPPLDPTVAGILDAIPGFGYQIVNGYLAWHFSNTDQGYIPHVLGSAEFRNIEAEILLKHPATFTDIETIIS